MADTATCDRCGADLLGADVRYLAEIKVWAAYDTIEIGSLAKLAARDTRQEYREALRKAEELSEEEAQSGIYWKRRYDLCDRCRKEIQTDPLGKNGSDADADDDGDGE